MQRRKANKPWKARETTPSKPPAENKLRGHDRQLHHLFVGRRQRSRPEILIPEDHHRLSGQFAVGWRHRRGGRRDRSRPVLVRLDRRVPVDVRGVARGASRGVGRSLVWGGGSVGRALVSTQAHLLGEVGDDAHDACDDNRARDQVDKDHDDVAHLAGCNTRKYPDNLLL